MQSYPNEEQNLWHKMELQVGATALYVLLSYCSLFNETSFAPSRSMFKSGGSRTALFPSSAMLTHCIHSNKFCLIQ